MRLLEKKGWILFLLSALAVSLTVSCEDDDSGVNIQNADNNKILSIMQSIRNRMDSLKTTKDPDNDFAMMMKVHHEGAISMGNVEINEGTGPELRQMATDMNTKQSKEIATLDSFLVVHSKVDDNAVFHKMAISAMQKMINNAKLQYLSGKIDHDFATLMIQHHQGAIDMADLELHYGNSDGLKKAAQKMKDDQEKEIQTLQDWLMKN
jgi:uncharacterized protein (DUF305 family)